MWRNDKGELIQGRKPKTTASESHVQSIVRLWAAAVGIWALRNNSGAFKDDTGRHVRFGLGNDSKKINEVFKSSDLVGPEPVLITQEMVGKTIARFWCREVKHAGWKFTGTDTELAQARFIEKINTMGGNAAFTNGDVDSLGYTVNTVKPSTEL